MATFYNQATLSYNGGSINSNVTVGQINDPLTITKTAIVNEYSQNSDITYAVNIVNTGNTALNNLTLNDNLGVYIFGNTTLYPLDYVEGSIKYFINGILQPQPSVEAGHPLVVSGITVPANGNVSIIYITRANSFAPIESGSTIVNTVTLCGCGIECLTSSETISVAESIELRITKSLSPTMINRGDGLSYTFVIQNFGNTATSVSDNLVISDTFSPILANFEVTYNGTPLLVNEDYSYNSSTGVFQTVAGKINVPAASYEQNTVTGEWTVIPGTATIIVTGVIN